MEQDQKEKDQEPEENLETAKMQNLEDEEGEWDVDLVLEDEAEDSETLNKMSRPCKKRRISGKPNSSYFKPAGIRLSTLDESLLNLPEFESIRLVDLNDISQEEAGKKMNISQSTLSRILKSGRKKIADAIVNGKAIKIQKDKN